MVLFNSNAQIFVIIFVNLVSAEMDSQETKDHAKKSFVSLLKNIVDVNEKRVAAIKKLSQLEDFIMTKNSLAKLHGIDMGDNSLEDFRNQNAILTLIDMRRNVNLQLRRTYNTNQEAANNNINIIIPFNSFNVQAEQKADENSRINNRNNYDGKVNIKSDYYGKKYKKNDDSDEVSNKNSDNIDKIIYGIHFKSKKRVQNKDNDTDMHNSSDDSDIINNENKINIRNEDYDETYNRIVDDNDSYYRKSWKSSSCDKRAAKVCRRACVSAHKNVCMLYKCSRRAKRAFRKECKRSCKAQFINNRYSDSDWQSE